jgi:hypothetical protein
VQREMLLRSASSPLLNCARAGGAWRRPPRRHVVAVFGGEAVRGADVPGDVRGGPRGAARPRRQDDGHGAPTPLSASSSASFSVVEDVEEEEEAEYDDDVVTAGATAPVPPRRLLTSTGLDSSSASTLVLVEQDCRRAATAARWPTRTTAA